MVEDPSRLASLAHLRRRAEEQLKHEAEQIPDMGPDETRKLFHELRTHQIELEMQNEELRRAQEELIESRDKYSDLYDFAPIGYMTLSPKGLILEANLTAAEMLGVERARLIDGALSRFVDFRSQDAFYRHCDRMRKGASRDCCEVQLARSDGSTLHAQLRTRAVKDDTGELACLRMAVTDITELHRANEELAKHRNHLDRLVKHRTIDLEEANRRLQQQIVERSRAQAAIREEQRHLRRLLEVHERDRKLVACEIHDGLVQPLAAAKMFFEAQTQLADEEYPCSVRKRCEEGFQLLGRTIDAARRLIASQRPMDLDELGLLSAVEQIVADAKKDGDAVIEYVCDIEFDRLASPLEDTVFRIVQEGLANALRHARSDKIRISLIQNDHVVRVEIEDWGVGFDPDTATETRFGLEGIRQRARLFGGRALVESSPCQGTRLAVELPIVVDGGGQSGVTLP